METVPRKKFLLITYGIFAIVVLIATTTIAVISPYFLIPPFTPFTPVAYILLTELWTPFAILETRFIKDRTFKIAYVVLVGIVALCLVGLTGGIRVFGWGGPIAQCTQASPIGGNIVYSCQARLGSGKMYYLEFNGTDGSPLMKVGHGQ